MRPRRKSDTGSVLLETAFAVPILLAVTVALVWVASLGATYVRALDAALTAARQAARGAAVTEIPGLQLSMSDGLAHAVVVRPVHAPLPLIGALSVDVTAEASALVEAGVVP